MLTTHASSVVGISCARIYLVLKVQWETDESWYYDPFLAVENAEIGATLFALSVPALKPFFANLFSKSDSLTAATFGRTSQTRLPSIHEGDKRLIQTDQFELADSDFSEVGIFV